MILEEKNNKEEDLSPAEETPVEEVTVEGAPAEETPVEEATVEETKDDNPNSDILLDFIIGKKIGMTRLFNDIGMSMPVTVIEAGPCPIIQIKSKEKDGYSALQIGFIENKNSNNPQKGHSKSAGIKNGMKILKEFKCNDMDLSLVGKELTVNSFSKGDRVNISGKSKGKGFAGHMKRHNFSGGRASHGKNSVMRKAGSIGAGTSPGRVWPGTRMAGRMGGEKVTISNLRVIKVDKENNLLFVKGTVPGPNKSILYISK